MRTASLLNIFTAYFILTAGSSYSVKVKASKRERAEAAWVEAAEFMTELNESKEIPAVSNLAAAASSFSPSVPQIPESASTVPKGEVKKTASKITSLKPRILTIRKSPRIVEKKTDSRRELLFTAIQSKNLDSVKSVLANEDFEVDDLLFFTACQYGNVEIVMELITALGLRSISLLHGGRQVAFQYGNEPVKAYFREILRY